MRRELDRCEAFIVMGDDLLMRCANDYNTHVDLGDSLFKLCVQCEARIVDDPTVVPVVEK